ncbi:hypothetical protein JOC37_000871 [Desulfohalotomaculum tongense]|uniref:hypothetical protein n=1 Tax=Desulforadius tongensis TaxID=1216062 RepID=UPI00195CB3B8|nr:hypothetical protein [Desulforadius tongensis]MBM7854498.1 hypothetical protein [Desulforadius tongensis]
MKRGDWHIFITGYIAVFGVMVAFLTVFLLPAPAGAHSAPEKPVDLPPLFFYEGERMVRVSFKDVQEHYRHETGHPEEFDMVFSYRGFLEAKKEIWGGEIPRREDIQVISRLPSPSSVLALRFITGGEEPAGDGFRLVLPNGTLVQDFSYPNLHKLAGSITTENYAFTVIRRSTGESVTMKVKEGVLTEEYFNLRSMVHTYNPRKATEEEVNKYVSVLGSLKQFFIDSQPWQLFEGVKRPFPFLQVLFAAIGIILLIGVVDVWREITGKKNRQVA